MNNRLIPITSIINPTMSIDIFDQFQISNKK